MTTHDLRAYLENRAYPTAAVKVLMTEQVAFELAELYRQHSVAKEKEDVERLDAQIAAKEAERDSQLFSVHCRATSGRAREDIVRTTLHEVPYQLDMYGRDRVENEYARKRLLRELIFTAHMTKITFPDGEVQLLTDENRRDVVRSFLDQAPDHTIELVDQLIERLNGTAEMQKAQFLDPNTLPES